MNNKLNTNNYINEEIEKIKEFLEQGNIFGATLEGKKHYMKKLGIEEFRGLCSLEGILDFKTYNIITERMIDIIWDLEPSKGETETLMTNYVGMVAKYDVMREIEDTLVEENKANLEELEELKKIEETLSIEIYRLIDNYILRQ